jgi:NAD(P) transhydrogenase
MTGENATEIVHIGQVVMDFGGNIRYFMENVFNYPTFAEAYRVAAFDGWKRIQYYNPAVE